MPLYEVVTLRHTFVRADDADDAEVLVLSGNGSPVQVRDEFQYVIALDPETRGKTAGPPPSPSSAPPSFWERRERGMILLRAGIDPAKVATYCDVKPATAEGWKQRVKP